MSGPSSAGKRRDIHREIPARTRDLGSTLKIVREPRRPGLVCIEKSRGDRPPRRLWLAEDEAEQLRVLLDRELAPVTVDRRPA